MLVFARPSVHSQSVFTWAGFSSTTKTTDTMSVFLGDTGDRTMWQLELIEPIGRDISEFSLYPKENEARRHRDPALRPSNTISDRFSLCRYCFHRTRASRSSQHGQLAVD